MEKNEADEEESGPVEDVPGPSVTAVSKDKPKTPTVAFTKPR